MTMKWEGVTPEQYEAMRRSVNWEGNAPKGGVFHVAGFHDNAIHVTDIWESAEELDAFVNERLMPGAVKAGVSGAPHVDVFPVHAIYVPALQRLN